MKKCNIHNTLGSYLFSRVHICDAKIAYLDDIANLEIIPYGLHVLIYQNNQSRAHKHIFVPKKQVTL